MSRRPTIMRVLIATCGLATVLAISAPAAQAKEFGSDPSATADLACTNQKFPMWTVTMANSAAGAADANFEVKNDYQPPEHFVVAPGTQKTWEVPGLDGIPSHLTVKADGQTIIDKTSTVRCWTPYGTITPKCEQPAPTLEFYFQDLSMATVHFVVHHANGTDESFDMKSKWKTVIETVQEDQPYDVWITADGSEIAWLEGTADCTTPPTTTPPTTTPPATTPTTVVVSGESVTAPPAAATPTTTAPATLPYTGASSKPLVMIAVVLILAGGSTVIALRRRATA
jgi:LPXTG-motif cell wall-anchored protein